MEILDSIQLSTFNRPFFFHVIFFFASETCFCSLHVSVERSPRQSHLSLWETLLLHLSKELNKRLRDHMSKAGNCNWAPLCMLAQVGYQVGRNWIFGDRFIACQLLVCVQSSVLVDQTV